MRVGAGEAGGKCFQGITVGAERKHCAKDSMNIVNILLYTGITVTGEYNHPKEDHFYDKVNMMSVRWNHTAGCRLEEEGSGGC